MMSASRTRMMIPTDGDTDLPGPSKEVSRTFRRGSVDTKEHAHAHELRHTREPDPRTGGHQPENWHRSDQPRMKIAIWPQ